MDMILDVHSDLYPVSVNDKITVVIARSLSVDGSVIENEGYFDGGLGKSGVGRGRSLADDYDYVMYGKCYKYEDSKGSIGRV